MAPLARAQQSPSASLSTRTSSKARQECVAAAAARQLQARWHRPAQPRSGRAGRQPRRSPLPASASMQQQQQAAAAARPQQPSRRTDSDLSSALSLSNIRQTLIRLEDTIIFGLIERAQFALNAAIYQPDAIPVPGFRKDGTRYSLLEYLLRDIEQVHGRIRRYTSPDEHPYYPEDIPALVLPPITYPQVLAPGSETININDRIMSMYLEHLLPEITQPGDDGNYGSCAMDDVMVLQALSKRIHYGKFVAEAKFRAYTAEYTKLIQAQDADGIMELLTDRAVELKVIERVKLKAATFGQDLSNPSSSSSSSDGGSSTSGSAANGNFKVRPEVVARLYEEWVMPLTKDVEVEYLLQRLDAR